jgi:hypothetical protein
VDEQPAVEQLQALEREVLIPAGRRWLTVRERGQPTVAFAAPRAEGAGFLDHVVTFLAPAGAASAQALTRRAIAEAAAAGRPPPVSCSPSPAGRRNGSTRGLGSREPGLASWLSAIPR